MFLQFLEIRARGNFIDWLINFLETTFTSSFCANPTVTPSTTTLTSVIYGQTYSQQFVSSDTSYYIWSASGLPVGASLDAVSGILSWTNVIPGTYTFTVRVDYNVVPIACFGTRTYTITISAGNYATTLATQADQYNRLQHFMCCLGSKGTTLSSKLKLGTDCCCEINTLELLAAYWTVLECYNPTLTTNCLAQAQVDKIWNHISQICGLCFSPYGTRYQAAVVGCGSRIVSSGEFRVTSLGDIRVVPCGTSSSTTPGGIGTMVIGSTNIVG